MNLAQWIAASRPSARGTPATKRLALRGYRKEVLEKAGTTMGTLHGANFRGTIGLDLARRLQAATAGTFAEFKIADQFPAANDKEQDWAA